MTVFSLIIFVSIGLTSSQTPCVDPNSITGLLNNIISNLTENLVSVMARLQLTFISILSDLTESIGVLNKPINSLKEIERFQDMVNSIKNNSEKLVDTVGYIIKEVTVGTDNQNVVNFIAQFSYAVYNKIHACVDSIRKTTNGPVQRSLLTVDDKAYDITVTTINTALNKLNKTMDNEYLIHKNISIISVQSLNCLLLLSNKTFTDRLTELKSEVSDYSKSKNTDTKNDIEFRLTKVFKDLSQVIDYVYDVFVYHSDGLTPEEVAFIGPGGIRSDLIHIQNMVVIQQNIINKI